MSKIAKRYKKFRKRNPSSEGSGGRTRNPPLATDLLEWIGPGFASFAATRFATRMASMQIAKRWPRFAKHAGALASVGSFTGAWLLGHKVKQLEKYHTQIIIGAGIAAAQSLIQIYFPRLGWIVSDASPEVHQVASGNQQPMPLEEQVDMGDPDFDDLDDGQWYDYNDTRDNGRYAQPNPGPRQAAPNQAANNTYDDAVFDNLEDSDEMQGAGGIFTSS